MPEGRPLALIRQKTFSSDQEVKEKERESEKERERECESSPPLRERERERENECEFSHLRAVGEVGALGGDAGRGSEAGEFMRHGALWHLELGDDGQSAHPACRFQLRHVLSVQLQLQFLRVRVFRGEAPGVW